MSKSDQSTAVMTANNLDYKFDAPLSVSVNRTMKKQFFATRSFDDTSGTAICDWNSGVDAIDPCNSYLVLRLRVNAGAGFTGSERWSFGVGSAMNLFQSVKILSSSGTELARTENANLYHKVNSTTKHSEAWFKTVGAMMGTPPDGVGGTIPDYEIGIPAVFVIPLTELDPFFNLYDKKLIPSTVASGLRIELALAQWQKALLTTGATDASGYTIENIEFRNESLTFMDSAQALLNKEASTNGLEVTYDRIFSTQSSIGTSLSENHELRKAVALAKNIKCCLLPTANALDPTLDSFVTTAFSFSSLDGRIANQYYPSQPIETAQEAYIYHLKNAQKVKSPEYETCLDFTSYIQNHAYLSFDFERDDSLNLSACPVNQSRVCEVRYTRNIGTSATAYLFLTYTALCRSSLSNTSVKI